MLALVSLGMVGLVSTASASHKPQDPKHCTDHDHEDEDGRKVEGTEDQAITVDGEQIIVHFPDDGDGREVEFYFDNDNSGDLSEGDTPANVQFCIKAAQDNSGVQNGTDGEVTWTNGGGQTPRISYVVVYRIVDCDVTNGGDGQPVELDLEPETADNQLPGDTSHTVTATVTDADGTPCEGVAVRFQLEEGSTHSGSGTDVTDENGEAEFTYTGSQAGSDTITACFDPSDPETAPTSCTAEDPAADNGDETDTVTKTWTADTCESGEAAVLDADPETAENQLPDDDSHTVTATVTDANGNPCQGVEVRFVRTGTHQGTGTATTDENGQATHTYTGTTEGEDTITACFDPEDESTAPQTCTAEDATPDDADETDTVTKTWSEDGGELECNARVIDLNDQLILIEASPDAGCTDDFDNIFVLINETLGTEVIPPDALSPSRLLGADTEAAGKASARVLELTDGSTGTLSVIGADADCGEGGEQAWILRIQDGTGATVLIIRGGDPSEVPGDPANGVIVLPNLELDPQTGIWFTRTEEGTAEAVKVAGPPGYIAVASATCTSS